jgi:hypothetical protein
VANYFLPGPDTRHPDKIFRVNNPKTWIYLRDNYVDGAPAVNESNGVGIQLDDGVVLEAVQANLEFPVVPVATQRARDAYQQVLEKAGCTLPWRDAVDERIVESVRNRTGHVIDSPAEVGGWPELRSIDAKQDSDGDGLPDSWERKHGLDPNNPADGAGWAPLVAGHVVEEIVLPPGGASTERPYKAKRRHSGYTNLEMYLHEKVGEAKYSLCPANHLFRDHADHLAGIAHGQHAGWKVPRDHAPRAHHGPSPDRHARQTSSATQLNSKNTRRRLGRLVKQQGLGARNRVSRARDRRRISCMRAHRTLNLVGRRPATDRDTTPSIRVPLATATEHQSYPLPIKCR